MEGNPHVSISSCPFPYCCVYCIRYSTATNSSSRSVDDDIFLLKRHGNPPQCVVMFSSKMEALLRLRRPCIHRVASLSVGETLSKLPERAKLFASAEAHFFR